MTKPEFSTKMDWASRTLGNRSVANPLAVQNALAFVGAAVAAGIPGAALPPADYSIAEVSKIAAAAPERADKAAYESLKREFIRSMERKTMGSKDDLTAAVKALSGIMQHPAAPEVEGEFAPLAKKLGEWATDGVKRGVVKGEAVSGALAAEMPLAANAALAKGGFAPAQAAVGVGIEGTKAAIRATENLVEAASLALRETESPRKDGPENSLGVA